MTATQTCAQFVDVERNLRNQHGGRPASDSRGRGDPACVTAHHFDHHDSIVTLSCCVETVDCVGGNLHGRVEAECHVRADDVVVDRLRHANDWDVVLAVQTTGNRQAPVAADHDEPIEAKVAHGLLDAFHAVLGVERAPAPGTKHRSAAREHAAHEFDRQRDRSSIEHAVPRVEETNQLVTIVTLALAHDGADDRVQSGAVASSG